MGETLIVNLRHYLNEEGTIGDLTKPAERLVSHLGEIVRAVSHQGKNEPVSTEIRCRKRPNHNKCTGMIVADLDRHHTDEISWHCPVCGDNGVIYGWRGTIWDNSNDRFGKENREIQLSAEIEITLDDLEDRLFEIDADALTIPELHGFLSAVIVGPEVVNPSVWLPHVFNLEGKMPEFSSRNEANRVFGKVFDFYNRIIRDMDTGQYQPIFGTDWRKHKEVPDPVPWCLSFDEGISLTENAWSPEDDEALATLMFPIYYFIDPEEFSEMSKSPSGRKQRSFDQKMISMIPDAVLAVRNYWREKMQDSRTHKAKGVVLPFDRGKKQTSGRNDPCPCGSGKKYKYCCGKEE